MTIIDHRKNRSFGNPSLPPLSDLIEKGQFEGFSISPNQPEGSEASEVYSLGGIWYVVEVIEGTPRVAVY